MTRSAAELFLITADCGGPIGPYVGVENVRFVDVAADCLYNGEADAC